MGGVVASLPGFLGADRTLLVVDYPLAGLCGLKNGMVMNTTQLWDKLVQLSRSGDLENVGLVTRPTFDVVCCPPRREDTMSFMPNSS